MQRFSLSFLLFSVLGLFTTAATAASAGNILVSTADNILYEYTRAGVLVQQSNIPANVECCGYARDLVVTDGGEIAVYNGTFEPILSIFDGSSWSELSEPDWSTANNVSYGGIASAGEVVYTTDMYTGGGPASGIVRFDLISGSAERFFDGTGYIDLNLGLDGKLYALRNTYGDLDRIDPATMTLEASVDLGHSSSSRSIAVNAAGEIFMASWNGDVVRYDTNGVVLATLATGANDLTDIDLDPDGTLVIGSRFGQIVLTDENFTAPSLFNIPGGPGSFVTFVPASATVFRPWQENANGTQVTGIAWHYAMGYHFTPQTDGQVVGLGGLFNGTKTVKLFEKNSGVLLTDAVVTAANDWSYTGVTPVPVQAGVTYTVAVYLEGSGASYRYYIDPLPRLYGAIQIEGSTYAYTGSNPDARPINSIDWVMYGQADIEFIADTVDPGTPDPLCDSDDAIAAPASGMLTTGPASDFIALCNGWVLLGDRTQSSIESLNAVTDTLHASYPLAGAPGALALDADNGLLYAGQTGLSSLAQIDLSNAQQSAIALDYAVVDVTFGYAGQLFATLEGPYWWERPIALIDGPNGTVAQVFPGYNGEELLAYDPIDSQLIAADQGLSPSSLVRYSFDAATLNLIFAEERWDAGGNGQDLAISPDGDHLAFAAGGGNGAGYTIFDFSTDDFSVVHGEWATGAYPRSAAFSPDGAYVVASNGTLVQVFEVATHALVQEYSPDLSACSYSQIEKVGFSRGGGMVYAFSNCGFDDDSGRLFWATFAP